MGAAPGTATRREATRWERPGGRPGGRPGRRPGGATGEVNLAAETSPDVHRMNRIRRPQIVSSSGSPTHRSRQAVATCAALGITFAAGDGALGGSRSPWA